MPWNSEQYHKFQNERSAPFDDLFTLITVREGLTVVALGCGTGELTRHLADRLPGSTVRPGQFVQYAVSGMAVPHAQSRFCPWFPGDGHRPMGPGLLPCSHPLDRRSPRAHPPHVLITPYSG